MIIYLNSSLSFKDRDDHMSRDKTNNKTNVPISNRKIVGGKNKPP